MVVFLDIDGVMAPMKSWKLPDIADDGFLVFNNNAIAALNKLITEDTQVILTTSHKSKYFLHEWKEIFKRRGIDIKKLNRLDDNDELLNRRDEILKWFDSNPIPEKFVIIDDDKILNSLPSYLKRGLIQTNSMIGLTEELVKHIIDETN